MQGIAPAPAEHQSGKTFLRQLFSLILFKLFQSAIAFSYFYFIFMFSAFTVDLSTALTGDALSGILNNAEAIQQLEDHLPAVGGTTEEQLRSTLASPQFQQVEYEKCFYIIKISLFNFVLGCSTVFYCFGNGTIGTYSFSVGCKS